MKAVHLNVKINEETYPIYIGHEQLSLMLNAVLSNAIHHRMVIMVDPKLVDLYAKPIQQQLQAQGFSVDLCLCPAEEAHKTRETKQVLEDYLLSKNYMRDTCLIAIGGGVVCDLVGFLASTYCRGVPVIYIPTTLLAMVDASIGGKTGVNTPLGKNTIGTTTQPKAVLIDIALLDSLPDREYRNGLVEIIKHAMILERSFFDFLVTDWSKLLQSEVPCVLQVIEKSCEIKRVVVEADPNEKGLRKILNFGHTIGHAIEAIEAYRLSHGEAVAMGLIVESYLSLQLGYLPQQDFDAIFALVQAVGLNLKTQAFQDKPIFLDALQRDKKNQSLRVHCVLLDKIGQVHTTEGAYTTALDSDVLNHVLTWAEQFFS